MTVEISKTVEETSHAAREVAAQIAAVSAEASETGRRALEIRDGSALIAGKVDDLRKTLVRVIRTSTSDVDRRLSGRVQLDRPGHIEIQGRKIPVRVRDVSFAGALLDEGLPQIAEGTRVILSVEGLAFELPGTIGRKTEQTTLIGFQLTDSLRQLLGDFIERSGAAKAA
jgi:methyl-accepting chemotaxis protein